MTVHELIKELKKYPKDMPVRISQRDSCRDGEYWSIYDVREDHLENQDTSGDPSEYYDEGQYNDESECPKQHMKYKGKLVLIL